MLLVEPHRGAILEDTDAKAWVLRHLPIHDEARPLHEDEPGAAASAIETRPPLPHDLRYLAGDARVGQPEIALGVIPGAGGTQRLTRLVGPGVTRHLVYTGMQLDAATAVRLGIAEMIHPAGAVFDEAVKDARSFARGPRQALAAAKHAIRAATETSSTDGMRVERDLFLDLFGTEDQREGMRAFLEKRPPRFGRRRV